MKFSIIVPVYNSQISLKRCLDAIFSSEMKDFEVIVIDDGSRDNSSLIAKGYPAKLVTLNENLGRPYARNIGAENSQGEILVFIDSDITIKKNTLKKIGEDFKTEKNIVAVIGVLSKECPHKDFFSQYKNLYMHYIFRKCPRYIDFLYSSLAAIKKDCFLRFDERFRIGEDTELGQRYKKLDKKILLNPELEVTHLKKYNFKKIIRNDFSVPFWWVKSFMLHRGLRDIFGKRRFAHARMNQLMNIFICYLITLSLILFYRPGMKIFFCILLFINLVLNLKFFGFLCKERGFLFLVKSIAFTYLDSLIMGSGILAGFIHHLVSRKLCNISFSKESVAK